MFPVFYDYSMAVFCCFFKKKKNEKMCKFILKFDIEIIMETFFCIEQYLSKITKQLYTNNEMKIKENKVFN